jgi:hypothetical protein
MEGCMGLRFGLDETDEEKDLCPARHRNPTVKPLAVVFTKLLNIILHTTGSQFSVLMEAHRKSEEMSE